MAKLAATSTAVLLLLLLVSQVAAYRSKVNMADEEFSKGLVQADEKADKAAFCPSICIPCANGKRSVLVSRSRDASKFLDVFAVTAIVVGGIFQPWVFLGLPAYAGLKVYTDTLYDECPNIEIVFFDKNESGKYAATPGVERFDPERLQALLAKDEYLELFKKDLDRVYTAEQAAKEGRDVGSFENMVSSRIVSGREQHQLPDSLLSYAVNSDLFCEEFGEDVGNITFQTAGEALGWTNFFKSCAETVAVETKRCCCKEEKELTAGDQLQVLIDSPDGNYKIGDIGTIDRIGHIAGGEKRFQINWEHPLKLNWTTHALDGWENQFKRQDCKLMEEDDLKKSWNPMKWGELVCPSHEGYRHYDRFMEELPDSCKE